MAYTALNSNSLYLRVSHEYEETDPEPVSLLSFDRAGFHGMHSIRDTRILIRRDG